MLDDEQLARLDQTERELLLRLSEKVHGRESKENQAPSDFVQRRIAQMKAETQVMKPIANSWSKVPERTTNSIWHPKWSSAESSIAHTNSLRFV